MIGETILAGTSARCKQVHHWRDNMSLIIGLQSVSWWSVNIYCANCWPTIGAPIIVPPILARSSAVSFNSENPTWDRACFFRMVSIKHGTILHVVDSARPIGHGSIVHENNRAPYRLDTPRFGTGSIVHESVLQKRFGTGSIVHESVMQKRFGTGSIGHETVIQERFSTS